MYEWKSEHKNNNLKIWCSYGNGYSDFSINKDRDRGDGDCEEDDEDDC
jgi:hypothetical protein